MIFWSDGANQYLLSVNKIGENKIVQFQKKNSSSLFQKDGGGVQFDT